MIVTVKDNKAMAANWGHGLLRVIVRTVEIADTCPQCGGPRGEVRGFNGCEDGDFYHVNVWDNPCGHIDYYEAVIVEAERLKAEKAAAPATGVDREFWAIVRPEASA